MRGTSEIDLSIPEHNEAGHTDGQTVQNQEQERHALGKADIGSFSFLGKHFGIQCRCNFNRKLRMHTCFVFPY